MAIHKDCIGFPHVIRISRHHHRISFTSSLPPGDLSCGVCHLKVDNNYGAYSCSKGEAYFVHTFQLDLRCASITLPFKYEGHKHPLFLAWDSKREEQLCPMCKFESYKTKLICMECDYIICFSCLTFPYKARYKHDSHFLTICDGKEASDQPDWCEVCQGEIEEVKERGYQGHGERGHFINAMTAPPLFMLNAYLGKTFTFNLVRLSSQGKQGIYRFIFCQVLSR